MSELELKPAKREEQRLRIAISGPSGTGKTFSSLLLASGLVEDRTKIAVIDAENKRALAYSHIAKGWQHLTLGSFSPEDYVEAIKFCDKQGMQCVILDGISPEWQWCLDEHAKIGGRYQDWKLLTPRHDRFMRALQMNPMHTIVTIRRKKDYQVTKNENGKVEVVKAGTKECTREDVEYEFDCHFSLDRANIATAEKDITSLFMTPDGNYPFKVTEDTGKRLLAWSKGEL